MYKPFFIESKILQMKVFVRTFICLNDGGCPLMLKVYEIESSIIFQREIDFY